MGTTPSLPTSRHYASLFPPMSTILPHQHPQFSIVEPVTDPWQTTPNPPGQGHECLTWTECSVTGRHSVGPCHPMRRVPTIRGGDGFSHKKPGGSMRISRSVSAGSDRRRRTCRPDALHGGYARHACVGLCERHPSRSRRVRRRLRRSGGGPRGGRRRRRQRHRRQRARRHRARGDDQRVVPRRGPSFEPQ